MLIYIFIFLATNSTVLTIDYLVYTIDNNVNVGVFGPSIEIVVIFMLTEPNKKKLPKQYIMKHHHLYITLFYYRVY